MGEYAEMSMQRDLDSYLDRLEGYNDMELDEDDVSSPSEFTYAMLAANGFTNIENVVCIKETDKSRLIDFEGNQKWVSKSLSKFFGNSNTISIKTWYYNKLKQD